MGFAASGLDRDRETGTLFERVYYTLRERLLRGRLRLGDSVSSRRLAEELGMSHLPVSQALRRLENEGFLEAGHVREPFGGSPLLRLAHESPGKITGIEIWEVSRALGGRRDGRENAGERCRTRSQLKMVWLRPS